MRYNNYPYRRRTGYKQEESSPIAQKLVEQFLTQLVICIIAIGIMYGAQWLKIGQVEESMYKIKLAIEYSPSWDEIIQNLKDIGYTFIDNENLNK